MTEFTFLDELYFYVSTVNPQRADCSKCRIHVIFTKYGSTDAHTWFIITTSWSMAATYLQFNVPPCQMPTDTTADSFGSN